MHTSLSIEIPTEYYLVITHKYNVNHDSVHSVGHGQLHIGLLTRAANFSTKDYKSNDTKTDTKFSVFYVITRLNRN